jgi:hypothetical protein
LAPSNPPRSLSFDMHPTPNSFVMEDPSPLAEPPIPHWKTAANTGAAATLAASASFIRHPPTPISLPSSTASLPMPVSLSQTPLPTRSITLTGGVCVVFTENDVPRLPSVSFARDIKKDFPVLNGMWDDCSEHWAGTSYLTIHGHPIPIAYWKAVYSSKQGSGWKPGEWKIIKSNYFDWKVSILILFLSSFVSSDIFICRF